MRQQITELRKLMAEEGVDVYFVPSGDPHGSEYFNPHYKVCEYLSGLVSEAASMLVTQDGAWLWTDGRFFLQAEIQLAGSGIELMRMGDEGVPKLDEFLRQLAEGKENFVLGFDGSVTPAGTGKKFEEVLSDCGNAVIRNELDLGGRVWKDRPDIKPEAIWKLPLSSAGKTADEKIAEMRTAMAERGADWLLLTDLMECAWLLNLRGGDIDYTPVFFSFALVSADEVRLYVMDGAYEKGSDLFPESVDVRAYDSIYDDVKALPDDAVVWYDPSSVNYSLYLDLPDKENSIGEKTPAALAKTVKNETEIRSTLNAHIKDGVAVTKFIRWVKEAVKGGNLTEIGAADHLEALRREQEGCFDISFGTIAGYGPNGAIIHYAPTPETDHGVKPEGFFLVDSGGQYIDGTTDITRTIAVGPLTDEMIDGYTRVLKGHIAVSRYVIHPETTSQEIDAASRAALQEAGMDFNHGVSHGVGHVLAVHEGPAGIRKGVEGPSGLKPGMIISNEPGLYIGGSYGIRIENEILMKDAGSDTVVSEPITVVPYEREAIDVSLLTDEELEWLNSYHAMVREKLMPYMSGADEEFLISETQPLCR